MHIRPPDCTLTRALAPSETDTSARGAYLSPADRSASLAQVRKTIHFCILREYIVTQKRRYKSVCVQDISNDIHRKLFGNGRRQWPVKTLGEPTFNWASDTFTDVVTGILSSSRDKEDEYVAEASSQGLDALAENVGMWVRVSEHCSLLARRQST